MKQFNRLAILILMIYSLVPFKTLKAQSTISLNDFKIINNTSWEGTLTYIDYESGKPVPVATTMQIRISNNTIEQDVQYTWEPNKNIKSKTKIKKNGKYLGKQKVISKTIQKDGRMQIITSYYGKDNNKKAVMYYTYKFGSNSYEVTKEVQFKGSNERFMRNIYRYTKIK